MRSQYAGSILRVATGLAGVGLLAAATDWPAVQWLSVAVALVLAESYLLVERRLDLNRGWVKLPVGAGVVAVGVATLDGPLWAAGLFVAMGAWLVADGVYDLRHGDLAVWHVDSLQYYQDLRDVHRALADEPRDIETLAADLDLPVERVEATVETLRRRGRAESTAAGYRGTDQRPLWLARPVPALRRTARRLARPLGRGR